MEAAERSELGDEKISGFRTPVWEREEKHEKGKECATGTDKGVQISEPQSIGARHKGLAQISGLDFTPHTPPKLITVQQSSISKAQPALTRSLSVFSRRRWRKKQPQLEGPQRIIEGTLDVEEIGYWFLCMWYHPVQMKPRHDPPTMRRCQGGEFHD